MVKSYTFNEKNDFSKIGIDVVSKYLYLLGITVAVENVEDDPKYQRKDIDLIWVYKKGDKKIRIPIEVKTDKYTTGNFWLETISNESLGTRGCFVKSEAKFIFYYFTELDSLYVIPLKKAVPWFIKNMNRFKESKTTTKDENEEYKHTTVGRIVSIKTMMEEIKEMKLVNNISKKINNS